LPPRRDASDLDGGVAPCRRSARRAVEAPLRAIGRVFRPNWAGCQPATVLRTRFGNAITNRAQDAILPHLGASYASLARSSSVANLLSTGHLRLPQIPRPRILSRARAQLYL